MQLDERHAEESRRQNEHPSEQRQPRPRQTADDELRGQLRPETDMHNELPKVRLEGIGGTVRRREISR